MSTFVEPSSENTPPLTKEERKRIKNRKKKARQKAKKLEQKRGTSSTSTIDTAVVVDKATRKTSGKGRGQGLFASSICAYCFKPASAAGRVPVEIPLRKQDGRVGLYLAEKKMGGALSVVINGCADDSANSLSGVMPGDLIVSVDGVQLTTDIGALDRCLSLIKLAGVADKDNCVFPLGVRRVALQPCLNCSRAAICIDCDKAGFGAWHSSGECQAFKHLPSAVTQGESSAIRMMLRYKATAAKGDWTATIGSTAAKGKEKAEKAEKAEGAPPGTKEPLALVHTLQANTDVVPPKQRAALSKLTGVPEKVVSLLIGQIRGNAASIERGGNKVGCALSAHMGYCNHDCTPNTEASVDKDGFVTLRALAPIEANAEICISYIDVNQHIEQRLKILESHYEFRCTCARCLREKRAWLKAKAKTEGLNTCRITASWQEMRICTAPMVHN